MSQSRTSNRLRRSVAAFIAAAALVFGGSIATSPAYAADGDIQINDINGAVPAGIELVLHSTTASQSDLTLTTDGSGLINVGSQPDDVYEITPADTVVYDASVPTTVMVAGGVADVSTITLVFNSRVFGSLPNDAGPGLTTIDLLWYSGGTWVATPVSTVVMDPDGDFSLPLINGPGSYTLHFTEDDSTPYLSSYLGPHLLVDDAGSFSTFSSTEVFDLGDVTLITAGTIEGTVNRPDTAAVPGIDVHAESADEGNGTYTAQTQSDGTFRIKLSPNYDYQVWIDSGPWVVQYFNNQPDATSATPVNPAPSSIGIDFVLQTPPPALAGDIFDDLGDYLEVETYLYKYDVDDDEFVEVGQIPSADSYRFEDLEYGDYRLAFRDSATDEWIAWQTGHYYDLFLDTYISPASGEECYVPFDVDPGYGNLNFDVNLLPNDSVNGSCKSPAVDGDDNGSFSGEVTNYDHDAMGDVTASLFYDDGVSAVFAGSATVDSDGEYSIPGIDRDGRYYVLISTDDDQPWLDTWLGDIWFDAPGAAGDAYNAGSEVTAYRDSSGHDVELLPATVFSGTVTADGDPLGNPGVSVWDPVGASLDVVGDLDGTYTAKVPTGGDYYVAVLSSLYFDQYWEGADNSADATIFDNSAQEVNTGIDFDLVQRPTVFYGDLWLPDLANPGNFVPATDVTVHLYELQGYSWVEVDSQVTDGAGSYYFEIHGSSDSYRTRFSDVDDNWLGLTEALSGTGGPRTPWNTVSSCSFDYYPVYPADQWFGDGVLDPADITTCGPEMSVLSGRLVETQELSGGAPIVNQFVEISTDSCGCGGTTYSTFTDSDGYFSFNGLPDDTYYLNIDTSEHTTGSGEHSYEPYYDSISTNGSAYFGEIELVRFGNVYGHIDNWDASMTGATVMVIADGGGSWDPSSYIETEVDSSGDFDVPGVNEDGEYTVAFFMPDSAPYLDSILGGQYLGLATDFNIVETFTGVAEEDYHSLTMTVPAAQFIHGEVSYLHSPDPVELIEGAAVVAVSEDLDFVALAETDVNGEYLLKVLPGGSYQVLVTAGPPYLDVAWDGHYGCGCEYDAVTVGAAGDPATTGIDFHLLTEDDVVVFDLYTSKFNGNDFDEVTVHLFQKISGVWTETATSETDLDGLTLLYGLEDDDYRVKFSDGSTWLPIVDVADINDPGAITLADQCYYDFSGTEIGDVYEYDFHLNEGATAGVCGNAAAPPSGGGSSHHSSGGSAVSTTSTPTPAPTPTPTATSTPDDDGDDDGSVPGRSTDDATDEPATPAPSFPWLGWLIVVVIVLCVGGAGFVILRRR